LTLVLEHPSTCSCALFRSIAPNFSRVSATRERQTLNLTHGEFKKRGTYQPSTRICCLCYLMANSVALEATAKILLDTCTFHPDQQCTPSSQHIGGYDAHKRTHAHIQLGFKHRRLATKFGWYSTIFLMSSLTCIRFDILNPPESHHPIKIHAAGRFGWEGTVIEIRY